MSCPQCGCSVVEVVNVPGVPGINSFTFTTAAFTIPAVGSAVTINVQNSAAFVALQYISVDSIAHFQITSTPTGTSFSATYLGLVGDQPAGTVLGTGSQVNSDGVPGQPAYTTLVGIGVTFAFGYTSLISVKSTGWMAVGQILLISDGTNHANLQVTAINTNLSLIVNPLNYSGDNLAVPYPIGSRVVCAGVSPAIGNLPTAITDNSAGTATGIFPVSVGEFVIALPIPSLVTGIGTTGGTWLIGYTPGFAFQLLAMDFVTTTLGTGAAASQTFQPQINGSNVTGGAVNVTLASTNTLGKLTAGSAVTAANAGTNAQAVSIVFNTGGTVFTAGAGYFLLKIKNMDMANSMASVAAAINTLITAL